MNSRLLVVLFSLLCLSTVFCSDSNTRQPRILNQNHQSSNRRNQNDYTIEEQNIENYKYNNGSNIETTIDDVIEEIIDSSRQGRNVEGLDEVYSDPSVVQALTSGDDTQARNIIRDKLCDLGLMECEKARPSYYINSQNVRPQYPPFKQIKNPNGIYGPPQPVPLNYNYNKQSSLPPPPRKIGFSAPTNFNNYNPSQSVKPIHEKFSTEFFEQDSAPSTVKFGYTEKPTIVVNQGKREVPAVSQNTHVHHHYVHAAGPPSNDGLKTVFVNTPISEYTASDSLPVSTAFINKNRDQEKIEYNGFTSSNNYGLSSNAKPVVEGYSANENGYQNQYNPTSQHDLSPNSFIQTNPQTFTAAYNNNNGLYKVGASYHATQPDFYKKELNLNGNRDQNGYFNNVQQASSLNKYSNKYNNIVDEDCICVPADQCPSEEIVRRDDLVLPIDPRNLPIDIEAESDNINTTAPIITPTNSTEHKISKRQADTQKADGQSVSTK